MEKLKELIEKEITCIEESGVDQQNVDVLGKLVDIHKDIANEEYWEKKKEAMEMRYEDDYYGGRRRDSRGRYMTGRGGYMAGRGRGNYGGEEKLEEMHDSYRNYSEAREEYNRGNYGAGAETMESFKYMLKSFKDFFKHLQREAGSQEEIEMLQETAREIADM